MVGRYDGFTTVELAVALVLIGLLLAFAAVRIDTATWKLDAAGREVMQRLRAARALAVLKQHDVVVSFEPATRAIVVHEDGNGDGLVDGDERVIRHALGDKLELMRGAAPPYAGFTNVSVGFSDSSVTFRRNGSASEEGAVYVSRPEGERVRVVVVRRATGYVEVYRYDGSKWSL